MTFQSLLAHSQARRSHARTLISVPGLVLVLLSLATFGMSLLSFLTYHEGDEPAMTVPRKEDFVVTQKRAEATVDAPNTKSAPQQNRPLHEKQHPTSFSPSLRPASSATTTKPHYHMVFSTSCSPQQDWESFVFFYHAYKVRQPGSVTRIASGCSEQQERELVVFHERYVRPMSPSFHLHLTPQFDTVHADVHNNHSHKGSYKYMNKPYGLRHWMEHPNGLDYLNQTARVEDDIVMLLDPDMILLRPLVHDFTHEDVIWVEDRVPADRLMVRRGHPISQQDGYLGNQWMYLSLKFDKPPDKEGPLHWNSGPPYLATVRDMHNIAVLWTDWAPRVLHVHHHIFSEMYGLIFATLQLKLPFTFLKSIVVSATTSHHREGWHYVDQLPPEQVCSATASSVQLPIGIHYCGRYMLGEFFFSKYRIKKNVMSCDKALLQVPPDNLYPLYNYSIDPPRADRSDRETYQAIHKSIKNGERQAKREAFMLCHLIDAVNEALRYYKAMACSNGTANLNETHSVYTDPSSW